MDIFLPEGLAYWAAALIVVAAFFTAALTAAFGLGGGLALLAVMSALLPALAVIPVHGAAQIGSNVSRFFLQRRYVLWSIVSWFSIGSIIGASFGGKVAVDLPVWGLQGGVGIFILMAIWGPKFKSFAPGAKSFFATGLFAGFLTMFFGATGPLAATMLGATKHGRLKITATHAACMVGQHGMKLLIFGLLGFAYFDWLALIALILASGFAGTALGAHWLKRMPERTFRAGFQVILTIIAFYLVVLAMLDFRTS